MLAFRPPTSFALEPRSQARHGSGALRVACLATIVSLAAATAGTATPIASLPNLASVSVWESTGAPTPFTSLPTSAALTTQLPDPLSVSNSDFSGTSGEFYDVFYSDAAGNFDPAGTHLTITALFDAPGQSGLNINRVDFNFTAGPSLFADAVTAFVTQGVVGVEAFPGAVGNAVDGDLNTTTFMGQTQGASGRMSITVAFRMFRSPERHS